MLQTRKSTFKLGLTLLVISTIIWLFPLVVPFLHVSGKIKIVISAVLLVIAEILFWAGVFFAGKEAAQRFRGKLNPQNWFPGLRVKDNSTDQTNGTEKDAEVNTDKRD